MEFSPTLMRAVKQTAWILGVGTALAVVIYVSGIDTWAAKAAYVPDARWAWVVRQWSGPVLGGIIALLAWVALWQDQHWAKAHRNLYRVVVALVLGVVLGAGLLNQVIVHQLAERARPRETVLADQPVAIGMKAHEGLTGNSMPSGHAAMGFAWMTPFFALRRRSPSRSLRGALRRNGLAYGFLGFGAASGLFIGYARMVMGAHFLSDVLMAGVLALALSPLVAVLLEKVPFIDRRWWLAGVIIAPLAMLLGNHFHLVLTRVVGPDFHGTDLPCPLEVDHDPTAKAPLLTVNLEGYGAPVSNVGLVDRDGTIGLKKWGIYHGLRCTARLVVGEISYD